ncbi:MAG TPA: DUF899 family protein [Phenylobacterium sp.]|uniref:DUF899 family protein n=1 Tax=Phenylobacterium sp. TaxID=1871053 RepID=UPI002CA098C6|nr:DUF899 family protein [Phenylobacterium sp.]HXA40042.1 DUF899 family protein [Phenylobacterium sp.]
MSEVAERTLHDRRFPNESAEYRAARERLLEAEIDLRRQTEAVAAQRRALPPGGAIPQDYVFEAAEGPVKLSELFGDKDTLLLYGFMLGPNMDHACPSCTAFIDALDGEMRHIRQQVAIAAVARSPLARFQAHAASRGWRDTRLLSSAANSFHRDYHAETPEGSQRPMMNVFARRDGQIRHAWGSELAYAPADPGQDPRHIDAIWPLWAALDLTPQGRGDFRPKLTYDYRP